MDEQWAVLEPLLPKGARAGQAPVWPQRQSRDVLSRPSRTPSGWSAGM